MRDWLGKPLMILAAILLVEQIESGR